MAWPTDLVVRNRRGRKGSRWFFVCGREGHKANLRKSFQSEQKREEFIHDHDKLFHFEDAPMTAATAAPPPEEAAAMTLGDLIDGYMNHLRDLVKRGVRSQKSVDWYERLWPVVIEGFGKKFVPAQMKATHVRAYIKWRFANSTTGGDIIVKELKAIQTAERWAEIPFAWRVPLDEIFKKVETKETLEITPDVISRLVRAMTPTARQWRELKGPSLEWAVVMTKLLTAMRTVELLDLRAGQVSLRTRTIKYVLHSKKNEYHHTAYIVDELVDILRPWLKDKEPDEHVFMISTAARGRAANLRDIPKVRPLGYGTLRARLRKASLAAKPPIDPPIDSFKHLRHEAITAATQSLSLEATAKGTGHRSIEVLEEHYIRRRHTDPEAAKVFAEAVRDGFRDLLPDSPVN